MQLCAGELEDKGKCVLPCPPLKGKFPYFCVSRENTLEQAPGTRWPVQHSLKAYPIKTETKKPFCPLDTDLGT